MQDLIEQELRKCDRYMKNTIKRFSNGSILLSTEVKLFKITKRIFMK